MSVGTTLWRGFSALHAGHQTLAAMFSQHSSEAKQNSPVNEGVQPTIITKSIVFLASCESGKKKFGMIEQLYKQPFASKEFPWTALHVFKVERFEFTFGLWSAENLTEKRTFILLSHVFTTFNSCNWWLCHAVPHTRTLQWYR